MAELPDEVLRACENTVDWAVNEGPPSSSGAMVAVRATIQTLEAHGYDISRWERIKGAPRDGTRLLVHGPIRPNPVTATPPGQTYTEVCPWWQGRWTITWMDGHEEPTHYRPLPQPPKESE